MLRIGILPTEGFIVGSTALSADQLAGKIIEFSVFFLPAGAWLLCAAGLLASTACLLYHPDGVLSTANFHSFRFAAKSVVL